MKKSFVLFTAGLAIISSSAFASTSSISNPIKTDGWFIKASMGSAWLDNTSSKFANGSTFDYKFNTGYTSSLSAGYEFKNHFSLSLESAYLYNSIDSMKFNNASTTEESGYTSANILMLNGIYHFSNNNNHFVPYIGVGIGAANIKHSVSRFSTNMFNFTNTINSTATVGAIQGIIGATYNFNQHWGISLDYRAIATTKASYKVTNSTDNTTTTDREQYNYNTVNFSGIYRF